MAICRTGDYPINFEEAGSGQPIILIHGHAVDLRVWDDVMPSLLAARLRVVRYDVRGHGRSRVPDDGYSVANHVEDLRALVAHLGVEEVVLCGFSMGGEIAAAFAAHYPRRVSGLVLVASALDGVGYSEEFYASVEHLRSLIREHGAHPTIEDEFPKHAFFDQLRGDRDAMDRVRAMMAGYSAREYMVELERAEPPTVDLLDRITAPTLVLSGTNDVGDLRLVATLLAEGIRDAEQRDFPGAGHMLPMERPLETAEQIVTFIRNRVVRPVQQPQP